MMGDSSSERIQTSSVRIVGNVLRASRNLDLNQVDSLVHAICTGLELASAKVRWNAAASIVVALSSSATTTLVDSTLTHLVGPAHLDKLIASLSSNLPASGNVEIPSLSPEPPPRKQNYKVQLQTTKALLAIQRYAENRHVFNISDDEHRRQLRDEVQRLLKDLQNSVQKQVDEATVPPSQFEHVEKLLAELSIDRQT
ncbi:hypothetical protein OIV83_003029 [Microbotryomycetes sp. JL201]|nr:hypothetical protein OIV83_003029 [Microbotryomycetes sp. JL201]